MNKKLINWWIGGASYSAAAQTVFTNIGGTLSPSVKNAIATFVDAEVAAGRWSNLDVFQLYGTALGSEAQGLKNWVSSSFAATNPNGLTASVNGYTFAASSSGILTNYNGTTGTNWTSTNAFMGAYVNSNGSTTDQRLLIGNSASTAVWYQRTVASRLDFINSAGFNGLATIQLAGYANGFTQGLYCEKQIGSGASTAAELYKDGSLVATSSTTSPVESNVSYYIGGQSGGGGAPWVGVLSAFVAGSGSGFSVPQFSSNFLTLITTLGVKI